MLAYITAEQLQRLNITYDSALPQTIFDTILCLGHGNPLGHIVVIYPPHLNFGGLFPVTATGSLMLSKYFGFVNRKSSWPTAAEQLDT